MKKLTAEEIRKENMNGANYTKHEHTQAPEFDAFEARCWNRELPNAEQYTTETMNLKETKQTSRESILQMASRIFEA